jgi:hypothetical protein
MTRAPLVIEGHQTGRGRPLLIAGWRDIERPLALAAFAALGGLLVYVVSLKQGETPSVAWYWILVGIIDGAIVLQILMRLRESQVKKDWGVLAQIVALKVLLSMMVVWSAPNGLYGRDSQFELAATESIARWDWPVEGDARLAQRTLEYSLWPGIHFLTIMLSSVTGGSHLELARYLPGALGALSIVFVYIAGTRMLGSGGIGLLATLASAHVTFIVWFQAQYIRESLAFPLLMGVIALVVANRQGMGNRTAVLFLVGALVLSHHLTSLVVVLLLAIIAVVYWAMSLPKCRIISSVSTSHVSQKSEGRGVLAIFAVTLFIVYAIYIGPHIIQVIAYAIKQLIFLDLLASTFIDTPRDGTQTFVHYGRSAVTIVMGLTVLIYVMRRNIMLRTGPRWSPAMVPLFLWVVVVGAWTAASQYGGVLVGADPIRLLTFVYPFLVLLFAQVTLRGTGSRGLGSRAVASFGVAIVAVFLVINLLGLPRYIYEARAELTNETSEVNLAYSRELYAANDWQASAIPRSAVLAGDHSTDSLFEGLSQRHVALDADFFESGRTSAQYDGFVLRQEMTRMSNFGRDTGRYRIFPLDNNRFNSLLRLQDYALAYDNGDIKISIWLGAR